MKSLRKLAGDKLGSLREQKKKSDPNWRKQWTQAKVAEAVGVETTTYQRWESGETWPDVGPTFQKLADYFDVEPGFFLIKDHTTISDLNNPDKILEILQRIDSRLPSEASQIEIERLKGEIEGLRDLIGPHRQILKALNDRPEMVPGVLAFLGLDRESDEGTENGDRSNRSS